MLVSFERNSLVDHVLSSEDSRYGIQEISNTLKRRCRGDQLIRSIGAQSKRIPRSGS